MKSCSVNNCDKLNPSRITCGMCPKHYSRWLRHGDVNRGCVRQSLESQKKRSESLKKYYATHPERVKKQSETMKAIRHAGNFKKGCTPWNKGIKWPERSGENHHLWKGGVTKQNKLDRVRFQHTTQQLTFQRDDYTCQICEQRGGHLQVDHIKSWKDYPELRFDLNNCRTLCMACHYYVTFKRKLPDGVIWGHNLSWRMKP